MMRTATLAALLLLAACHRRTADTPIPGADAEAATAAKTRADIEAAEQASSAPIAPGLDRPSASVAATPKADAALPQGEDEPSAETENDLAPQ